MYNVFLVKIVIKHAAFVYVWETCVLYKYNVWPRILQKAIYVGRPVLGKPTTSRTQLGTHKELAEVRMGH